MKKPKAVNITVEGKLEATIVLNEWTSIEHIMDEYTNYGKTVLLTPASGKVFGKTRTSVRAFILRDGKWYTK